MSLPPTAPHHQAGQVAETVLRDAVWHVTREPCWDLLGGKRATQSSKKHVQSPR